MNVDNAKKKKKAINTCIDRYFCDINLFSFNLSSCFL